MVLEVELVVVVADLQERDLHPGPFGSNMPQEWISIRVRCLSSSSSVSRFAIPCTKNVGPFPFGTQREIACHCTACDTCGDAKETVMSHSVCDIARAWV